MAMSAGKVGTFARWWAEEIRAVFSPRAKPSGGRSGSIVLTPEAAAIRIDLEDRRGRIRSVAASAEMAAIPFEALAGALSALHTRERKLPVVVRLPVTLVRCRALMLPAAALRDYDRLLTLELARSSPLKTNDLYHAYEVHGPDPSPGMSPGMLSVHHYLVKRRVLDPIIEQVAKAGLRIGAVECWNREGTAALPLTFHPAGEFPPEQPVRRLEMALAAAVLTLGLATTGLAWLRKDEGRTQASEMVARLTPLAQEARRTHTRALESIAEAERIRKVFDGRVPALAAVEEATKLMPDGAWVDELRIDGDTIELAGLARSGSSLLTALQASAMFHDTQFSAPLRFEPAEDRERFRLRARLRPLAVSADAAAEAPR